MKEKCTDTVSAETCALFYNKDLIAEKDVPKTWDALLQNG